MGQRIYTASATATGGRKGVAENADGTLKLQLARPQAMGGSGDGTNPEELFACGYAACFASTIDFIRRQNGLDGAPVQVTARISLEKLDAGGYGIAAELDVFLPSITREEAETIVERAKRTCPYSNATRGNVETRISLVSTS